MTAPDAGPMRVVAVSGADIDRMADRLFLDGRRKQSAFWVLLTLAAIIAGSGVVADSDATVIGAMIVAPLMTPILGTALAVVLADRSRILRGVTTVLAGAALVVALGFLLGLLVPEPVVAATNSEVASRVSPDLIDLVASLATGLVGAFALVRDDVSDTLPGVAIAISLVPPLAVVGLTLESGEPGQALGALLLFASNVAAIIATGTGLLLAYRLRPAAEAAGRPVGRLGRGTIAVVAGFVVLVAVPLAAGSYQVYRDATTIAGVRPWPSSGRPGPPRRSCPSRGPRRRSGSRPSALPRVRTSPRCAGRSTRPATPTSRSRSRSSSAGTRSLPAGG